MEWLQEVHRLNLYSNQVSCQQFLRGGPWEDHHLCFLMKVLQILVGLHPLHHLLQRGLDVEGERCLRLHWGFPVLRSHRTMETRAYLEPAPCSR